MRTVSYAINQCVFIPGLSTRWSIAYEIVLIRELDQKQHQRQTVSRATTLTGWDWVTPPSLCCTNTDGRTNQRVVLVTVKSHFAADCECISVPPTVGNPSRIRTVGFWDSIKRNTIFQYNFIYVVQSFICTQTHLFAYRCILERPYPNHFLCTLLQSLRWADNLQNDLSRP